VGVTLGFLRWHAPRIDEMPSSLTQTPARTRAAAEDASIGAVDWAHPPTGSVASSFHAPSGRLAVVSLGDPSAPRVVLAPGVTGSKEDFVLMMPILAQAGYFVQALDLAGQYDSAAAGPPAGDAFTWDLFVDDLVAFLAAGPPAHLLGYSFAGTVAQLVAAEHPELVLSLTLLATPPGAGNIFRRMQWLGPWAPLVTPRVGAALMIWGITTNKNRVPPERLAFVRSRFAFTSRRSVDDVIGLMMATPDVRDRVRALGIPLMVAAGTHDLWSLAHHARFAAELGAQMRAYDTGHSPCETTPHQLCADLLELYSRGG
jgi:pimeloyl-ACP methyl ester carboxylesterase